MILGAAAVAVFAAVATASPASAAPASQPAPPQPNTAGKAGAQPAPPLPADQQALLHRQDTLLPAAHSLVAEAHKPGSDIGGVQLDVAAGVVHLYRTNPALPVAVPGGAMPTGTQVIVHPAKFSRAAMLKATDAVTRDAKVLGEQQVSVQAVGPSVDGSGLLVTVRVDNGAELDRAESALRGRYGDIIGTVSGVQQRTSEKDLYYSGWRFNDYAPWYGGDRIASSAGGCSTGFAASYNNGPVMLTASHCGGVGTSFSNGPTTSGTFNVMGSSVYSNTATDVGAISVTSASNYINVGPAETYSTLYVGSWASPVVGEYLCQSGSYTGEVCGLRVVDTGQSVCLSWFLWWCTSWQGPLADVINSAGSAYYAAGHGDSGGPVYLRSNGSGIAKGLVHGVLTPNAQAAYPAYYPDTLWCPAPEGWMQRCSSGFSFAHMPGY